MGSQAYQHPVVAVFHAMSRLSEEAAEALAAIISAHEAPKNTLLLKLGAVSTRLYFINKGLARVYYEHSDEEVTDYFAIDGQFIGAVPSLFTGEPSRKAVQLVEDSTYYAMPLEGFEQCCTNHHDMERAARKIMVWGLLQEQERIESMRFHSTAQRYHLLEKKYPGITNRCPLKHIASYLGTTSVSISRIRSGIQ